MFRFRWHRFARLLSGQQHAPDRPRPPVRGPAPFRPRLEALEDRSLPSVQAVSVASALVPPADSGAAPSDSPSVSADGRYVAFESDAPNLVSGDTNNTRDVFVRDVLTGTTTLVSINQAGTASGNGFSFNPTISANGRYVAFTSFAKDLVANDINPGGDVFVRDLFTGTTTLVSVTYSGAPATGSAGDPVITPDGRYVAFQSDAANLTPIPNPSRQENIYVRDLVAGTTTLVSVNSTGTATGDSGSFQQTISADGRYIAFTSGADDLTAGDTNPSSDIYQRDLLTGTTTLVSKHYPGLGFGGPSQDTVMSADGRFVAFGSQASDLTPTGSVGANGDVWIWDRQTGVTSLVSDGVGFFFYSPAISADGSKVAFVGQGGDVGTNGFNNVYVRDLASGTITLVNAPQTGGPSDSFNSSNPVVSADGQALAFLSTATNLVAGATSGNLNVYVRNLSSGTIALASVNQAGTGDGDNASFSPAVSADGSAVAFASYADNLVPNDTNNAPDVFLHNLAAGTTALVSHRNAGLPARTGSGFSSSPSVSADGRYVAFMSDAPDLVPGDANGTSDIFVRDVSAGTTTLVSVNSAGTATGNGFSYGPSISADGRYVAFTSYASDLVPGDTNGFGDVFVRDLLTGTTRLVSANRAGTASANGFSGNAVISADGSHVAFESSATDLTANITFGRGDVFERDLATGTTTLVSVTPTGTGGNGLSDSPVLSADGGTVAFTSYASNLAANDYNGTSDIFVRRLDSGTTTLVTVNSAGTATGNSSSFDPALSANGKVIAYMSLASDLVGNDTNNTYDVFVYDLKAGTTTLVSVNQAGTASGNGMSEVPSISANGRYVAFDSSASDLAPNDTNGTNDIFVRDLKTGTTTLVSVNRAGTASGNDFSFNAVISADGHTVAFTSFASDLVGTDTNNTANVFVRNWKQGTTALASQNAAGTDGGNSFSYAPVLSADGGTVVFASFASDLAPGDYNNNQDLFAFT